jgi:hypothetical protein
MSMLFLWVMTPCGLVRFWRNILAPSSELKNIDISSTVSYEDGDGILDTPRTEAVQNLCGQVPVRTVPAFPYIVKWSPTKAWGPTPLAALSRQRL